MLGFHMANKVTDAAVDFLLHQGGAYAVTGVGHLQATVLEAVALDQYVLKRDECGDIEYFALWWWAHQEELDDIMDSFVRPEDVSQGAILYVAEAAVRPDGSLLEMVRAIRRKATRQNKNWQGCGWHNYANGKRPAFFRQQTGGE